MSKFNLDPFKSGLVTLANLTEDRFEALRIALDIDSTEISNASIHKLIEKSSKVDTQRSRSIYQAVRLLTDRQFDHARSFLDDLVDTLVTEGAITEASRGEALHRFAILKPCKLLRYYEATVNLLVRNSSNYRSAQGMTELRPAFLDGAEKPPVAYGIAHQLQLTYVHGPILKESKEETFFLSLDAADLDTLIEVLRRCKLKSEALEKQLVSMNIPYVKSTV